MLSSKIYYSSVNYFMTFATNSSYWRIYSPRISFQISQERIVIYKKTTDFLKKIYHFENTSQIYLRILWNIISILAGCLIFDAMQCLYLLDLKSLTTRTSEGNNYRFEIDYEGNTISTWLWEEKIFKWKNFLFHDNYLSDRYS